MSKEDIILEDVHAFNESLVRHEAYYIGIYMLPLDNGDYQLACMYNGDFEDIAKGIACILENDPEVLKLWNSGVELYNQKIAKETFKRSN